MLVYVVVVDVRRVYIHMVIGNSNVIGCWSPGHTHNDLRIMPFEEVVLNSNDNITLASKLLYR